MAKDKSLKKLLVVSAVPPPYSGPEVMTQHLIDGGLGESFELSHFKLGKKRGIETKGVFNFQNLVFGVFQPFMLFWRLLKNDYDVVFTDIAQNSAGFLRYSSFIWIASFFRCRIVTRVMGDGFGHFYQRAKFQGFVLATLNRIDRLIVRADSLKQQFEGLVAAERISVVYSGISLAEWGPPMRNEGKVRFLFVGYLTKAKGAFELLRAVRRVLEEVPNAEFVFVGPRVETRERNIVYLIDDEIEEDQSKVFDRILAEEGIADVVELRGTLSGQAKIDEYRRADVFVFPSYAEAFPTVVLEAMAAELPVITTKVGALPELFSEADIEYVTRGSVDDIVAACVGLAKDVDKRRQLGVQGRERVQKDFDISTYVRSTGQVLAEVVSDHKLSAAASGQPQFVVDENRGASLLHVVLFGHYGGKNTGDEAMLTALLENVNPQQGAICRVLGKRAQSELEQSADAEYRQANMLEFLRAVAWCDVFCIGGGTHFHDDYTSRRYLRHFVYMARIVCLGGLARLLGRKFVMVGAGVGPLSRRTAKVVTGAALRLANSTIVRDEKSMTEAVDCSAGAAAFLGFDLVALLKRTESRDKDKNLVGISLAYSDSFSLHGMGADEWWTLFAEGLLELGQLFSELKFRVIVFRGGDRESDQELSEQLVETLVAKVGQNRVELFEYCDDPHEMMLAISECGTIIATRYHAALMGYLAESSLIFLCYHRKLFDLAEEIGLNLQACIDFRCEEGRNRLVETLRNVILDGNSFKAKLPTDEARALAQVNLVHLLSL